MTDPAVLDAPPVAGTPVASPLADLILARVVTAKESVSPKQLAADLAPFFRRPPSVDAVTDALTALREAGFVGPGRGCRVTDAGTARALGYLGADALPPRASWGTVKAKYLTPKALGLPPGASVPGNANGLAAFLLKRKLGLPVGAGNTVNAVLKAVVCRELGFPDHIAVDAVVGTILGRLAGTDRPLKPANAAKVLPRLLLDAPRGGVDGLRATVLTGFADRTAEPTASPDADDEPDTDFDLVTFADTVASAARACPTGRVGPHKVFISHVWQQLKDDRPFASLGLGGFKDKLVDANRQALLSLSRADLVQAMDPADLDASATHDHTAVFHFVRLEGE